MHQHIGPEYPSLGATVAKYRKIQNPTAEQRRAHGDAVSAAIRALQQRESQRTLPRIAPLCASGTWHNNADGSVGRAIREQQQRALLAHVGEIRRKRTPAEWQSMYEDAMHDKRKAEQTC